MFDDLSKFESGEDELHYDFSQSMFSKISSSGTIFSTKVSDKRTSTTRNVLEDFVTSRTSTGAYNMPVYSQKSHGFISSVVPDTGANGELLNESELVSNSESVTELESVSVRADPVSVVDVVEEVKTPLANAGWFIALMCAIIFLLLILLIVCLIRRNRGGKYPGQYNMPLNMISRS